MTKEHIDGFIGGVVATLLALLIACQFIEGSWDSCAKQGYFVHENQKYECKPTGEWVEE